MSYTVEFTDQALSDIGGILDFLTLQSPRRGAAFVEALLERTRRKLGDFPMSGAAIGTRRFTVFDGYVVVYTVDEANELATVVLVTEGHRHWRLVLEARQ